MPVLFGIVDFTRSCFVVVYVNALFECLIEILISVYCLRPSLHVRGTLWHAMRADTTVGFINCFELISGIPTI